MNRPLSVAAALVISALAYFTTGAAALADDAIGCKDPSWAPQRLAGGFYIDSCEDRIWANFDVALKAGTKTLSGHRSWVSFNQTDRTKPSPAASAARTFFIQQWQKMGARLVSDPANIDQTVLTAKTAKSETWFIFVHYGNDATTAAYRLTMVEVVPIPREVQAQPMKAAFDPLAPCANPAWIARAPAHFKIDSCDARLWDSVPYDTLTGTKTLEGPRATVSYTLDDKKTGKPAAAFQADFAAALKAIGATVVSDPTRIDWVVATQKTALGELWYIYQHYSDDDTTSSFTLTTIQILPDPQFVQVQPMKAALDTQSTTCTDPPWLVKQWPQYKVDGCDNRVRDSITVDVKGGSKTLEGARATVTYQIADNSKVETDLGIQRNFLQAFKAIGATIVSDPASTNDVVATQKLPQGEFWYIYQPGGGNSGSRGSYSLTTIQATAFDQEVQLQPMKAPLDATAKCTDAPWVVKQFPQYKVSGCENHIWDIVPVNLPSGHRDLIGARTQVTYTNSDDKKVETDLTINRNYTQALKPIGATIVSDSANLGEIIATQKLPQGEFWYIYESGGGNSDSRGSYDLTTVQITPFPQVVQAQLMKAGLTPQSKPCRNPDWLVKQFSYFSISQCDYRDFDSISLDLADGVKKVVAGRILRTDYNLTDEIRTPTQLYAYKNYANALQAIGAKLVSDPADTSRAIFTQTTSQGEFWYIYASGGGNSEGLGAYELTTVQVGGPPPKTCTLEVYGVNFDFDKSTLRPDSEPVLEQLLAMFSSDPAYAAEISGHTDNVGTESYNMALSGARAQAVKTWLVAHGIAAQRITTKGYGDTKPLVPNTSDANRAKNRRVELKRTDCR